MTYVEKDAPVAVLMDVARVLLASAAKKLRQRRLPHAVEEALVLAEGQFQHYSPANVERLKYLHERLDLEGIQEAEAVFALADVVRVKHKKTGKNVLSWDEGKNVPFILDDEERSKGIAKRINKAAERLGVIGMGISMPIAKGDFDKEIGALGF